MELVGDDISGESWNFKIGKNSHTFLAWLAWYGPTKFLQKLIFRTPLVFLPIAISEAEQDLFYWPFKYKTDCQGMEGKHLLGKVVPRVSTSGDI